MQRLRLQSLGRNIEMERYRVQITDRALADMGEIYSYIAEQLLAPENAMGQYDRIAEAIEGLCILPERIRLMESEPEHSMELRQLIVDHFSVFYKVEKSRVIVLRVLYSAADKISREICVKYRFSGILFFLKKLKWDVLRSYSTCSANCDR